MDVRQTATEGSNPPRSSIGPDPDWEEFAPDSPVGPTYEGLYSGSWQQPALQWKC
jgi:hypothetical protein